MQRSTRPNASSRSAQERDAQAQAGYESKLAERQAKRDAGKKPGGKDLEPPTIGPQDKDKINLTDEQSRIMKTGGGFDKCYNAQATVDTYSMLIVASFVTQAGNDSQQVKPMLAALGRHQEYLDQPSQFLADSGYFSAANVDACEQAGITLMIAMKRSQHHEPVLERFTDPPPRDVDGDAVTAMAHRLKTRSGRADYGLRKQTVEPVFRVIKNAMKSRQFLVRGVKNVGNEWNLVALAWIIKRMSALKMAGSGLKWPEGRQSHTKNRARTCETPRFDHIGDQRRPQLKNNADSPEASRLTSAKLQVRQTASPQLLKGRIDGMLKTRQPCQMERTVA